MNIGNNLSLVGRIEKLMKKKLSVCQCNPCTCSEDIKELYFLELEDIVKSYNIEKLVSSLDKNLFPKLMNP